MGRRDAERDPGGLDLRFARTSRLAIVSSGTRKARAISSVRSPPSVRSVSATWPSSASWVAARARRAQPLSGIVSSCTSSSDGFGTSSSLSSPRACGRGGCDRAVSPGRHQPGAGILRRPVARPALGGGSEGLLGGPRRGRSRRGSRSGRRGRGPTRRGRSARGWSALHERAYLHGAAHAGRRNARGELDRGVEVVGLEEEVAAERL